MKLYHGSLEQEEKPEIRETSHTLDYGKGFKAKVSLSAKTEVGRDYLDKIESGIKAQYHTDVSISKGYWVRLCVLYRSSGSEQEVTRFARIYKIDGKWYLLDVPSETQ